MSNAHLQLQRLQRHYDSALQTYDEISLLDLSHSLRIWSDLKGVIHHEHPKFRSTLGFSWASAPKKLRALARDVRHVIAFMPGGVVTLAAKGHLVGGPPVNGAFAFGVSSMDRDDGALVLKNFVYVEKAVDGGLKTDQAVKGRGNFVQWMGSEAVRIGLPNEKGEVELVQISQEMMIKRVANSFDGSHPSSAQPLDAVENRFDPAVKELMKFKMGGLPLPYFILMKAAQEILEHAPKLLESPSSQQSNT